MNSSDNSENQKALFVGNDPQTELILSEKLAKASIPFVKSQTLEEALNEISSGNIEQVDSGYRITANGIRTVEIFRFISKLYPVSDKFIYPNQKE